MVYFLLKLLYIIKVKMDRFLEDKPAGALIPILKPLEVECTLYMLRLTPLNQYVRAQIEDWLASFTANWVVARENSKKAKEHFHITIYDVLDEEELRGRIRSFLALYFTEPAKRGDANKQYNLTVAESVDKAINYTVKELDITYGSGMDKKYMDSRIKSSYLKFDKHTFAKAIDELKNTYKTTDMTLQEFMIHFVKLKAQYRQPINLNYIYQTAIACQINREPKYAITYVEDFLHYKNL